MRTEGTKNGFWAAVRPLKPLRLDLYVLGEVLGPFLGGVIFFSFVFLMFQALRLAEFFIIHGTSGMMIGRMVFLLIVSFLPTALPVAFLISVLVGFGRLSADSELVAMKSGGVSVVRLAYPVVFLSLFVVVFSLNLNKDWVPWSERTFKETLIKVSNTKVVKSIKEGTFTSGFFDLLIFADRVDSETEVMHRVFIYDERKDKTPMTIVAKEGEIVPVKTKKELSVAILLKLRDGNIHRNDTENNSYQKIDFEEYRLFLKVKQGSDKTVIKPRMLGFDTLKSRIARAKKDKASVRELKAEYWRRYAMAFSPLIFVFLGIGYGTIRTRAVRASAALVALVVILCYWALQAAGAVIAQKGWIPPFAAMQIGNLAIGIAAVLGFRKAMW